MIRALVPILIILIFVIGLSVGVLDDRVISSSEVETKIKSGEPADFDNYIIIGDLNFSGRIKGGVHFNNTIFQNKVKLTFRRRPNI